MAKVNPEFGLTEEEMIRQMQEADPDPQYHTEAGKKYNAQQGGGLPVKALPEFSRGVPAPTTPRMTEEEMIRAIQAADPDPNEQPDIPWWQVPWEAGSNFGQSARKFFGGMWESATHPYETGEALARLLKGGAANLMTPEVRAAMVAENPNLQSSIDSANAVGQEYINRHGSVQKTLNTLGRDPVGWMADASTFIPGAQGVAPTRVLSPLTRGTGAAVRGAANALDGQGRLVLGAAEGMENNLVQQLRDPLNTLVPGSTPTAAQAVSGMPGVPTQFQALGEAAKKRLPTPHNNVQVQNNQARIADVNRVSTNHTITPDQITRAGGSVDPTNATIAELDAAIRAADATNYGPIDPRLVTADQQLVDLLNRPSGDTVLSIAREIAEEEGRTFPNLHTPATASPILGPNGQPLMTPATFGQLRGEDLIRIKKAYDRLASSRELRAKYAIDDDAARQISATRSDLVRWMEDPAVDPVTGDPLRLPEHATAVADHRDWSRLRDRRQARDVFRDTLLGPMGEEQLNQRFAAFANLMDSPRNVVNGNRNVGKATTFDYDNWAELLTPEDLEILNRNLDDMSRIGLSKEQARLANRHSNDIDNAAPGVKFPNPLSMPITATNALLSLATGRGNARISRRTANAMLTPEGAAELLEQAIARREGRNISRQAWNNLDETIQMMNAGSAGVNVLNYEREKRKNNLR